MARAKKQAAPKQAAPKKTAPQFRTWDRATMPDDDAPAQTEQPTYRPGDVILDSEGRPWRFEPRWPGDTNPWAYCG
jgi:hypothetical protein